MRISGYCHNSSTGIKLIILLLLILWGALIVAIPMFFVKGSNALLIAMYLQNIGMFILPAWIAAPVFVGCIVGAGHARPGTYKAGGRLRDGL